MTDTLKTTAGAGGLQQDPSELTRAEFIRAALAGAGALGLLGAAAATSAGCASLVRRAAEDAVKGGADGAKRFVEENPEVKRKLDELVANVARVTSETATTAEKANETLGKINELIERNEPNIDRLIEESAAAAENIRKITDVLRGFAEILERFKDNVEALISVFVYLFNELAKRVAREIVELIAFLIYLMFINLLRNIIEELKRRFWPFRWLAVVLR